MKFSMAWSRLFILTLCLMPIQVAAQFTEYVPAEHRLFVEPAETRLANSSYVPLFNGRDFEGWEITGESKWEIIDGAMVARPGDPEATTRGMAGSDAVLNNFILRFRVFHRTRPGCRTGQDCKQRRFFSGAAERAAKVV